MTDLAVAVGEIVGRSCCIIIVGSDAAVDRDRTAETGSQIVADRDCCRLIDRERAAVGCPQLTRFRSIVQDKVCGISMDLSRSTAFDQIDALVKDDRAFAVHGVVRICIRRIPPGCALAEETAASHSEGVVLAFFRLERDGAAFLAADHSLEVRRDSHIAEQDNIVRFRCEFKVGAKFTEGVVADDLAAVNDRADFKVCPCFVQIDRFEVLIRQVQVAVEGEQTGRRRGIGEVFHRTDQAVIGCRAVADIVDHLVGTALITVGNDVEVVTGSERAAVRDHGLVIHEERTAVVQAAHLEVIRVLNRNGSGVVKRAGHFHIGVGDRNGTGVVQADRDQRGAVRHDHRTEFADARCGIGRTAGDVVQDRQFGVIQIDLLFRLGFDVIRAGVASHIDAIEEFADGEFRIRQIHIRIGHLAIGSFTLSAEHEIARLRTRDTRQVQCAEIGVVVTGRHSFSLLSAVEEDSAVHCKRAAIHIDGTPVVNLIVDLQRTGAANIDLVVLVVVEQTRFHRTVQIHDLCGTVGRQTIEEIPGGDAGIGFLRERAVALDRHDIFQFRTFLDHTGTVDHDVTAGDGGAGTDCEIFHIERGFFVHGHGDFAPAVVGFLADVGNCIFAGDGGVDQFHSGIASKLVTEVKFRTHIDGGVFHSHAGTVAGCTAGEVADGDGGVSHSQSAARIDMAECAIGGLVDLQRAVFADIDAVPVVVEVNIIHGERAARGFFLCRTDIDVSISVKGRAGKRQVCTLIAVPIADIDLVGHSFLRIRDLTGDGTAAEDIDGRTIDIHSVAAVHRDVFQIQRRIINIHLTDTFRVGCLTDSERSIDCGSRAIRQVEGRSAGNRNIVFVVVFTIDVHGGHLDIGRGTADIQFAADLGVIQIALCTVRDIHFTRIGNVQ